MGWLKNHSAKLVGFLTALQAVLDMLGDSPVTHALGAHGGKYVILAGSVVTALLTFLAPGKAITAPPAPTITTAAKFLMVSALAAIVLCAAPGCATSTQAVNQSLLATATLNNTAIQTIDALLKAGTIPPATATAALALTDDIDAALALANTAQAAGQASTATAKLSAVGAALGALQGCLSGPPTTLASCLQGITAP